MLKAKISTIGMFLSLLLAVTVVAVVATSFMVIRETGEVDQRWRHFENVSAKKTAYLQQISSSMGYGGMIHQFKNYVLRQDSPRISKARARAESAMLAIADYRKLGVDGVEEAALATVLQTIQKYEDALPVARRMAARAFPVTA